MLQETVFSLLPSTATFPQHLQMGRLVCGPNFKCLWTASQALAKVSKELFRHSAKDGSKIGEAIVLAVWHHPLSFPGSLY